MPGCLYLPDAIDGRAWLELQGHNLAEEVYFRDFRGWVSRCRIEEDPQRPSVFRWVIEMESMAGKRRHFNGEFIYKGVVIRPVYKDRFHRKAVI